MNDSTFVVRDPISSSGDYWHLDAGRGWAKGGPMEPLARALTVVGAGRVDAWQRRALDANSGALRSLVDRECQKWRLGPSLGPHASGELPQRIYDLDAVLPRIRRAGFREVMEILRC